MEPSTGIEPVTSSLPKTRSTSELRGRPGGGSRIRTCEGVATRFTVWPLWPLGHPPAPEKYTQNHFTCVKGWAHAPASLAILSSGGYNWKPLQCVARAAAHNPKGGRRGGRYVAVQLGVRGAVSAAYRRGLTDTVLDLRHIGACAPRGALESVWDRNRPRKTTPIASGFGAAAAARATRS
jgi:hypothetical protein